MRPISRCLSLALLVGCLIAPVAGAGEQECGGPYKCDALYKGRMLTPEELATILRARDHPPQPSGMARV
jgi:hypothetical protein